ncbi:collagen triple helix repeat protein [Cooperia oncophora]
MNGVEKVGKQGTKGKTGPRGPRGEPGDDGDDGEEGEIGPPGITGGPGEPGEKGAKGKAGSIGLPGIPGVSPNCDCKQIIRGQSSHPNTNDIRKCIPWKPSTETLSSVTWTQSKMSTRFLKRVMAGKR